MVATDPQFRITEKIFIIVARQRLQEVFTPIRQ